MLSAVQIYNNPIIQFKSETFIILAVVSWTYLLHAYYRGIKEEYRYFEKKGKRKVIKKTKFGADRHWDLRNCLECSKSPVDRITKDNLYFLIGLRDEIEHHMSTKVDATLWERFQACCINYNKYLESLFGMKKGVEDFQPISLQFSTIAETQLNQIKSHNELPKNISSYIADYDSKITDEEINDTRFALRIAFVQKAVNRTSQADRVFELIPPGSTEAEGVNKESIYFKETEKPKYPAKTVVRKMTELGYTKFNVTHNTALWKKLDGQNPSKGYGIDMYGRWFWYDPWLKVVENHCRENKDKYIP